MTDPKKKISNKKNHSKLIEWFFYSIKKSAYPKVTLSKETTSFPLDAT